MTEVSEQKAVPGWYPDKRWPGEVRRWDGGKWLDEWRPAPDGSWSPGTWMLAGAGLGALLAMLAGVAFAVDAKYGWPALWIAAATGGVVFNIGAIGKAVEVGIRAARR
jgi:hypothetical protein